MKKTSLRILLGAVFTALVLSACGGSSPDSFTGDSVNAEDTGVSPETPENPEVSEEADDQPEATVDCGAEGFCEAGHACSENAECASHKCEFTVGLCIDACGPGFTFWTANGGLSGSCVPTPLPPPPSEAWM